MMTLATFLNVVVKAAVVRLMSRALPTAPSARYKLAREFVALCRSMAILVELIDEVTDRLSRDPPVGFQDDEWLISVDGRVCETSDEMLGIVRRLKGAIEIFDPPLAKALEVMYESKFAILTYGSASFDFDTQRGTLVILDASDALCALHVDNLIRRFEGPDILEFVDWPYGSVIQGLSPGDDPFDEISVPLADDSVRREKLNGLLPRLALHRQALVDAGLRTSDFIRAQFSISDVV